VRIHVLGSGAGGGVPQWNCGCAQCREARDATGAVHPRTQSSLCVSRDGRRWALLNASPDVRTQLASFPALAPPPGTLRGSGVAAVLLTNADIDHTAGLLVLREGGAPPVYSTEPVRRALTEGLSILPVLEAYGPVDWREIRLGEPFPVRDRGGASLGLAVTAFAVASKPPPYMLSRLPESPRDDLTGDTIGLTITAEDGGTAVYVPGVRDLDDALRERLARADLVLIDGTFFTDDEMVALGVSTRTARQMGHAPLLGDDGLLAFLATLSRPRKVLVHINNTNPILVEDGDARRRVAQAGVEVAYDGMEIAL
jgi:pyrroloquinoline quinone biosynthesis protein B